MPPSALSIPHRKTHPLTPHQQETCISQAAAANGCPTLGDIACRCSKMAAIQGPAVSCVAKTCPGDAVKIQTAAEAVCACVKKGKV
jgi:CFEM domain